MFMENGTEWALTCSKSTRGARLVLAYLAYIANEWGQVFTPVKDIAAGIKLSRQSVTSAMKRLVELGDIVPMVKDGRSWVYRLACYNEGGEFIVKKQDGSQHE
jgi:DNA-binding MarR family transcriptional regulator